MPSTSFTTGKEVTSALEIVYGDVSDNINIEIAHGNVKVEISTATDDAGNNFPDDQLYGDVTITYSLSSYQVTKGSIDIEYSLSSDGTYNDCTRQGSEGDAITPLVVSQNGTEHTFVWDSATDLGDHFRGPVFLRIRAYDRINQNGDFNSSNIIKIKINNAPAAPTINSPISGSFLKDQTPEIIFTIADSLAGNARVHFRVEIDTDDTFKTDNLKVWESSNSQHLKCFYYDSDGAGTYLPVPSTGVDLIADPTLINNNVKFIIPTQDALSLGQYYVRVTESEVV